MEKNLHANEAVKKLQELVSDIRTCMMITSGKTGARASRPMAAVDTDHMGNIWFFTNLQSNKVKDIEIDHFVQLVFAHPGKDSYLDVRGRANVITDAASIREKWNVMVKAWFPEGISDPDICLLQIKTDEVHYWDTENSKMVRVLQAALSIVAGKPLVEGVHGELNV
ncbi:MAG: pyridoxamine 5'-phosphate oxidase family protein [Bacteroidota bacterium]